MSPMRPVLRTLSRLARRRAGLPAVVLPAAHSWSVGAEEAAYHATVHAAAPSAELCADHERGHHHHSGADCRLCPLYASARLAPHHGLRPAAALAAPAAPRGIGPAFRPSADLESAPVRGRLPPAAAPAASVADAVPTLL
jgi:hypothetical protein